MVLTLAMETYLQKAAKPKVKGEKAVALDIEVRRRKELALLSTL